jgi:hypothetical protein
MPNESISHPARVALYGRVSTLQKQDPELQLRELREYAARRGWEIADEYIDRVSGSKDSRPGLNRLMADAGARKFDAVLVWKLDRFGRSLRHLVNALAELEALGVAFCQSARQPRPQHAGRPDAVPYDRRDGGVRAQPHSGKGEGWAPACSIQGQAPGAPAGDCGSRKNSLPARPGSRLEGDRTRDEDRSRHRAESGAGGQITGFRKPLGNCFGQLKESQGSGWTAVRVRKSCDF